MRLWDRQCCWDCRTPKDYPTVHRTVGWELLAFLVGLMGIPMECPMCQQGTWDVLSGQGMLKANLDMSGGCGSVTRTYSGGCDSVTRTYSGVVAL